MEELEKLKKTKVTALVSKFSKVFFRKNGFIDDDLLMIMALKKQSD